MGGKIRRQARVRIHIRTGIVIAFVLVSAIAMFIAEIFLPFTAVTKLWLFQNQIPVYPGLIILCNASELFLFLFAFAFIFPFLKINVMPALWLNPRLAGHARRMFHFVANMGKWSMLDVFVVEILVLTIKSTGVARIRVGDGFFHFVSIMLTPFASLWTGRIVSPLHT